MVAPERVLAPAPVPVAATAAEQAAAREVRRAHPLYADVTLRLLTEIMNSRLFTTVRLLLACPARRTIQAMSSADVGHKPRRIARRPASCRHYAAPAGQVTDAA